MFLPNLDSVEEKKKTNKQKRNNNNNNNKNKNTDDYSKYRHEIFKLPRNNSPYQSNFKLKERKGVGSVVILIAEDN